MDILLVEDDTLVAETVSSTMKKWNHNVLWATGGRDAISMAQENTFDLILLDIMLPDGLGHEFIPDLRKHQPEIKIITMTGYNTPDMETEIRSQGIHYYMAKPISLKELKAILDHMAKRHEPVSN